MRSTPDSIAARAGLRYEDDHRASPASRPRRSKRRLLGILEDLTDDGTIDMRVRGVDGGERDADARRGRRSRELTQPEALLPGLGFDFWRPRLPAMVGDVVAGQCRREGGAEGRAMKSSVSTAQPVADFDQFVDW